MQKTHKYLGLQITVSRDVPQAIRSELHQHLAPAWASLSDEERRDVRIHVHHLTFKWHKRRFVTEPGNRVARLRFTLEPLTKEGHRLISFANHRMASRTVPHVLIEPALRQVRYTLTRDYFLAQSEFSDYVAVVIPSTCRLRDRRILIAASGSPTADHGQLLFNVDFTPITKLTLMLDAGTALRFAPGSAPQGGSPKKTLPSLPSPE